MTDQFDHVNVRNVMDAQIRHTSQFGGSPSADTMTKTRNAIIELIEADMAFDAAQFGHVSTSVRIAAADRRRKALDRLRLYEGKTITPF